MAKHPATRIPASLVAVVSLIALWFVLVSTSSSLSNPTSQSMLLPAEKSIGNRTGLPFGDMIPVAMKVAVADEKLTVSQSLTVDGRIGKISDAQGIVVLRPMQAKRWTPICRETLLRPGDWIRTEVRGANAGKLTLTSDVEITLGPGTLLECLSPTQARLHSGMAQLKNDGSTVNQGTHEPQEFTLLGPREGSRIIDAGEKLIVRTDRNEKLADVANTPQWLAGFEGTSNNESLGSLVVTLPDGRNEPLTIGYHKVSVEIRDQIARTTIEESFVNHTAARLEGVFHFPLPQEASISGFGMWIGNDLIEADVVEKQRAREIYETILREKRDPGLLEWTGGNIFKARVFPIEARSEKRIKIVYTQVLPLRTNRYRYSYGLRSELLRTTPLRELALTVTVNSALPLKSVTCPTHAARKQMTKHSAQVEFSAQEYSPTRDFEVVCEIDGRQSEVVVVPHQRGDDGYFLMQLTPPATDGDWQREVLPDGEPLNLVLLCDTSMSMNSEKRSEQAEFVAAILASLGPDDRFQLVAADVTTTWASTELMAATAENVATAEKFLSDRISLGWTDLDQAFGDVLGKSPANANIVYIGDGVLSAGDTDPAAFVKRLAVLASGGRQSPDDSAERNEIDQAGNENRNQGVNTPRSPRTLHAVTVGNTYDSGVMRGIATVGGGSVRSISGEQTPQIAARELLNEIAQPGLRDLNVEFKGLKVAAVYPEKLPNVAAGTQQILVGRYLPDGADQQGEIIVTGQRGTEDIRYVARVNLKDAEEGNSFIPRLWARSHLDHLLRQGSSQAIQDDIIRLSEEFHIITPYTSLLVLETDADRERFGVQRRYEMRDGERFFAEGRDNASFELLQQQMQQAGDWRIGMRRKVLSSLADLGRDAYGFKQQVLQLNQIVRRSGMAVDDPMSGIMGSTTGGESDIYLFNDSGGLGGGGLGGGGFGGGGFGGGGAVNGIPGSPEMMSDELSLLLPDEVSFNTFSEAGQRTQEQDNFPASDNRASVEKFTADKDLLQALHDEQTGFGKQSTYSHFADVDNAYGFDGLFEPSKKKIPEHSSRWIGGFSPFSAGYNRSYFDNQSDYGSWMDSLFPVLPTRSIERRAESGQELKPSNSPQTWSPEAIFLADSLLRTTPLLDMDGGIELRRDTEYQDLRWNRSSGRSSDLVLFSPTTWLTRTHNVEEQTIVHYCDAKEYSAYSLAFGLGRKRASVNKEWNSPPLGLSDFSTSSLQQTYAYWNAAVESAGDNQARLILTPKDSTSVIHFTIDTARHVLLKQEYFRDGKLVHSTTFDDFINVAGTWWARRIVQNNEQGQTISATQLNLQALTSDNYAQRLQQQLADKPTVQFLRQPRVALKVARQRVANGTATFDDHLAMILHNTEIQQWEEMWKHVDSIEKLAADKPGVRWIRTLLLAETRHNEEARQRLIEEARRLAMNATQDEVFLAEFILGHAKVVSASQEFYALHQLLKPVYTRPLADRIPTIFPRWPEDVAAELRLNDGTRQRIIELWNQREASTLEQVGRHEEAVPVWRAIAEAAPWNAYAQETYADHLKFSGEFDAAQAWLLKELARPERSPYEDETLRTAIAESLREQGKWNELLEWTTEWVARNPETTSYYYSAYALHLTAMIFNDQLDDAYVLADQWLADAGVEGKLTKLQRLRLSAALSFANGHLPHLNFERVNERWYGRLADTARFFLRHPHHMDVVTLCTSNYDFIQSDAADQLRGDWLNMLRKEAATLSPAQLRLLIEWSLSGRMALAEPLDGRKQLDGTEVPDQVWIQIAATLKERWLQSRDTDQKHELSESLVLIFSNRFRETELLPFLRERLDANPGNIETSKEHRDTYASELFANLLAASWSTEIEAEAFAVLRQLSQATDPIERLSEELPSLYHLVDSLLENRISALEKQLSDQGELNLLSRRELAEKKATIRKTARTALAVRLAEAAADNADAPIAAWFRIEQIWLDIQLGQNFAEAEAACWKILGDAPPRLEESNESAGSDRFSELSVRDQLTNFFESRLKRRAFATVMNLAVRARSAAESVNRFLNFIDKGIADGGSSTDSWRQIKFRLLIALDRPDDLERELREWIRVDVSTAPWRQMLAQLLAERGKLDEAVTLLEACEKDKLLTSSDFHLLSNWYLVSNRRSDYERTRIESFRQMPENQLQRILNQSRNRWSRDDIPKTGELDDDTLFALRALFEKSANPEQYFYQVKTLYGACRDFRLLQMLPDAIPGRSPQQVYAFLQSLQDNLLEELRNEATADEILARVKELRTKNQGADAAPLARQLNSTDLRALDLLEALVERKSSQLLNQPGPHIEACLAAMQRAFLREWEDGEPVMMSALLRRLGQMPNESLRAEQLRELQELRKAVPAMSREHLSITMDLCELLFSSYREPHDALLMLESAVRDYSQAHHGTWPFEDFEILERYVTMLESVNRHAAGEQLLQTFLAKPVNREQSDLLKDRLISLYNEALENDGAVSIGTGREQIFAPLVALTLQELDAADDEFVRSDLVSHLVNTLDTGHQHEIKGTQESVQKFASETIQHILKRQQEEYSQTVLDPIELIREVLGEEQCLQYVVERMEQYPMRFEAQYENSWNVLGGDLASSRAEADTTDLDDRVQALAIAELQEFLRTGDSSHIEIFESGHNDFWREKSPEFAAAAESVLNERPWSSRRIMSVALYLRNGLRMAPHAIEILHTANADGILNDSEQYTLASWLREEDRFAEMIPIMELLVKARPDSMLYRTDLMAAYFHSQRPEELETLIAEIDDHFHGGGRWTEGNVALLANACNAVKDRNRAKHYFTEAIVLHQRSNPQVVLNDGTLSLFYQNLANVESALGNTKEAVAAAMSSIVCWSSSHENRQYALSSLRNALNDAEDLDAFIAQLDAESTQSGQDSPVLRKSLGQTFQNRNEHLQAIVQLKLALELQPNDKDIHKALLRSYDAIEDDDAASTQLRQLIALQPHDLTLYQQLANRMKDNPAEAERAATSIIESAPNEAESHTAMAELRQNQDRWAEAIPHWEQVARYRKLEPTGLLKLAEAQIHEKQFDDAKRTIQNLNDTKWPSHFPAVQSQIRRLEKKLP